MFRTMLAVALMLALGGPALADKVHLRGTLRDFSSSHPDFENTYNSQFPLITGMVKPTLNEYGKPVLDVPPGDPRCTSISVVSTQKDLSNVVIKLTNGMEYKYDGLAGKALSFALPPGHEDKAIVGCWVKAGTNGSGDGPGYGVWIPDDDDHYNTNSSNTIRVTFNITGGIPAQWRIKSTDSFTQWFKSIEGVNQSIPYTIVLDNGRTGFGGVYRFEASKHNGQSFFPVDDELIGNEGRSHNYHFTLEIITRFNYTPRASRTEDMVLNFSGDDDVWVFINRQLVVDLGGVKQEKHATVNVDAVASQIGLKPGKSYDLHFFFAERHTVESNFTLETNMPLAPDVYD